MGTGNPNPRLIDREQRHLDRMEQEVRDLSLKVRLNENFYISTALKNFVRAAEALNKETKQQRNQTNDG